MEEAPYDYGEGCDPEVYPVFRIACLDVGVDLMQSLDCFLVEHLGLPKVDYLSV